MLEKLDVALSRQEGEWEKMAAGTLCARPS